MNELTFSILQVIGFLTFIMSGFFLWRYLETEDNSKTIPSGESRE
jgi:CHASE3 domain sensor protein